MPPPLPGPVMSLELYGHPFSSYCMKVLIALYEAGTPFVFKLLSPDHPENGASLARLWPLGYMPLLVDDGRPVPESTIIIEHLDRRLAESARMIPAASDEALNVRLWDRLFDNHIMTPMQRMVADFMRAPDARDPVGVADARARFDRAYAAFDERMPASGWLCGERFTLADCAAAPALLYADWVHPVPAARASLRAYRARALARPSVRRVVDEARPYRCLFPPGAPDRD